MQVSRTMTLTSVSPPDRTPNRDHTDCLNAIPLRQAALPGQEAFSYSSLKGP